VEAESDEQEMKRMKIQKRAELGNRKALIFAVLIVTLVSVGIGCASATITVCHSGCDYASIQAAVDAADSGDTIEVHSGTYYEHVDVNKTLILKGVDTGSGKPVVDASGNDSAITLSVDDITLEGFNATNAGYWVPYKFSLPGSKATNAGDGHSFRHYAGILVTSNNNTITNNTASNNHWDGIRLNSSSNNTVAGNNVRNNRGGGIRLDDSCNNAITGNNVSNNSIGIGLDDSCYNTITGNTFLNDGLSVDDSYHNTIKGNTVNGMPLVYLEDKTGIVVTDAGQVILVNCTNITVENLDLSNTYVGVSLLKTEESVISNNTVSNNWCGIALDASCNNTITGNNASSNGGGITLDYSCNNNTITGNNASSNGVGICLYNSSNNTFTNNTVSNNDNGICLISACNNTFTNNTISNNDNGIYLTDSGCNNNIIGNTFVKDGLFVGYSYQNTVENNTVNGKPLVYLVDTSDSEVTDAGQVILVNCSNVTVEDLDLSNTCVGIELCKTNDSIISNNTVSNNNMYGILLWDSGNSTITGNNVSNNGEAGIVLLESNNNYIYLNNFINDTLNVASSSTTNILNSTEQITYTYNGSTYTNYLGNYWSDYKEKYPDAEEIDGSGILDTPYRIYPDNDNYPLMVPFEAYVTTPTKCTVHNIDTGKNYSTIQGAIEDPTTMAGHTITVDAGTYNENVVVNKALTLRGIGTPVIDAGGKDSAITLSVDGITLEGFNATNSGSLNGDAGIKIISSNNTLTDNTISNTNNGMYLYLSRGNNITGNTVSNSNDGIYLSSSCNNTIEGNTVTKNDGGIDLSSSHNNNIMGNDITNSRWGCDFYNSNNNTISNNTVSNNNYSMYLYSSGDNNLTGNTVRDNNYGIYLTSSCNGNTISCNYVDNNDNAIYISYSRNNTITSNDITNSKYHGICLTSSSNSNNITNNHVYNNSDDGIHIYSSSNNEIYLNDFINNTDNVYSSGSTNIWYSTERFTYTYNGRVRKNYLGNYWSDYKDKYPDAGEIDGSGLWNIPYSIDEDKDAYPLMKPVVNYYVTTTGTFDTGPSKKPYPASFGIHNGTIKPTKIVQVIKLYTYPCTGTGGHTEYAKICKGSRCIETEPWDGYTGDWHNISFSKPFELYPNVKYNYTIKTGSYPQIHHTNALFTADGWINCTEFEDANGNMQYDWIPAIKLLSD